MNALQKKRIGTVLKYTWAFYIIGAGLVAFLLSFIFSFAHPVPEYKTLTLFACGELNNSKQLRADLLGKFKEKGLKSFSCISAKINDSNFNQKLTVAGYSSADVFILTDAKLDNLVVSDFALELSDEMINSLYHGYTLYEKDGVNYGIKVNKDIVDNYIMLPGEPCYFVLSGKSINTGEYSPKQIKEYDMALTLVKDWGM